MTDEDGVATTSDRTGEERELRDGETYARLAVFSCRAWQHREVIAAATGAAVGRARPWSPGKSFDRVLHWIDEPPPRRLASLPGLYASLGIFASLRPTLDLSPVSVLLDDLASPHGEGKGSRLLQRIEAAVALDEAALQRVEAAMGLVRQLRLSRFNHVPDARPTGLPAALEGCVIVVADEPGTTGAIAPTASLEAMVRAACDERNDVPVIVVAGNRDRKWLASIARDVDVGRISVLYGDVNPWQLIDMAKSIHVGQSEIGFLGLLAGREIVCHAPTFYSGWGLTHDRIGAVRRAGRRTLQQLFHAVCLESTRYICPYDRCRTTLEDAAEKLGFLRDRFHDNRQRSICIGVTRWKRGVIAPLLDGVAGPPSYRRRVSTAVSAARAANGRIVTWATRAPPGLEAACKRENVSLVRIEDGFIRSVGLGAAYVKGASIAFDTRSIYYDAQRSNDLEHLLETMDFDEALLDRARRLREEIVRFGLTKYNVGAKQDLAMPGDRLKILVPGQVADDASIRLTITDVGRSGGNINLGLIEAARRRNPEAYIVFKPHPDIEAGLRSGRLADDVVLRHADVIARDMSILPLISAVDRVETLTSLAGFEALIRGKSVTCHGLPFYAGWGLTEDIMTTPRRTRRRSLDELVAAALLVYPRYIDPISLLPCKPELVVRRLSLKGTGRD